MFRLKGWAQRGLALAIVLVASGNVPAWAQTFNSGTTVGHIDSIAGAPIGESSHGDFNGDGLTDLIVSRLYIPVQDVDTPIEILLNQGGTFSEAPNSFFVGGAPGVNQVRKYLVEDFNRDGRDDVFIADHGYDAPPFPGHHNSLLLSRPDGKMQNATATLPNVSDFSHSAAVGDIDGDGDLDIYVNNPISSDPNSTTVGPYSLINDGNGNFTQSTVSAGIPGFDLFFTQADLNDVTGDGIIDLVLASSRSSPPQAVPPNYSAVRKGNGDGTFGAPNYAFPPKLSGANVADTIELRPIDFDGDGAIDYLTSEADGGNTNSKRFVQALHNDGHGVFSDITSQIIPPGFNNTAVWDVWLHRVDFSGDCVSDIVAESGGGSLFTWLPRQGQGFAAPQTAAMPGLGQSFDADGDGAPDFVSYNGNVDFILFKNLVPRNCAGLASAVLPASRTVSVGQFATAFLTVANARNVPAESCRLIQKVSSIETQLWWQETNPATNAPVGSPLRRFDVPAGGFKTFVFGIAPQSAGANTPIDIRVDCLNMPSPAVNVSVNRFSLTGAAGAAADVIPVVSTTSNDGIVHIAGAGGSQAFAAASVNVRDNEVLTVKPRYTGTEPLNLFICETNAQGACTTALVPAVSIAMDPNRPRTFTIIAQGEGTAIPADFASKRIVLEFIAAGGAVRGQASVAVTTG